VDWDVESTVGLVRSKNEDSWAFEHLDEGLYLAVVADGMGGYDGGEIASSLAVKSVTAFVKDKMGTMPLRNLLARAVESCNGQVFREARAKKGLSSMGTTLTAAIASENESVVHIAHIGDSRAYVIRKGQIRQITDDHSITGELVRNGTISEEDAMKHPARNVLTMAVGTSESVTCSMYSEKLFFGDTFLLCTDGLTSLVPTKELLQTVLELPRRGIAKKLTQLADSRGGIDNTTVIAFWPYRSSSGEVRCQA
jgi:serine/threonine protein phosphatase PrpC